MGEGSRSGSRPTGMTVSGTNRILSKRGTTEARGKKGALRAEEARGVGGGWSLRGGEGGPGCEGKGVRESRGRRA